MIFKKKSILTKEIEKKLPPHINASYQSTQKEDTEEEGNEDSSPFRDGFNLFADLEDEFLNISQTFEYTESAEGSDQNAQRKPPVKKSEKNEQLDDSFLLGGVNEKQVMPQAGIDDPTPVEGGNVVLTIDQGGAENVSNKIVKPQNIRNAVRRKGGTTRGI